MEQQTWPRSLLEDSATADVYDALIALWLEHRQSPQGVVGITPIQLHGQLMFTSRPLSIPDRDLEWAVWQLGQTWVEMPAHGPGVIEAPLLQVVSRRRDSRGIRRWTYRPCGAVRQALNREEEAA